MSDVKVVISPARVKSYTLITPVMVVVVVVRGRDSCFWPYLEFRVPSLFLPPSFRVSWLDMPQDVQSSTNIVTPLHHPKFLLASLLHLHTLGPLEHIYTYNFITYCTLTIKVNKLALTKKMNKVSTYSTANSVLQELMVKFTVYFDPLIYSLAHY